jgi:two-component sensor histidine kinase
MLKVLIVEDDLIIADSAEDTLLAAIEEKDRLLDQKKVLAQELQHRVRSNLQLIYGMLSRQLSDTPDGDGQRGIKAIARRVSALAQVYDHLLGAEMTRTTNFGGYLEALCQNLAEIQAVPGGDISLTCESEDRFTGPPRSTRITEQPGLSEFR